MNSPPICLLLHPSHEWHRLSRLPAANTTSLLLVWHMRGGEWNLESFPCLSSKFLKYQASSSSQSRLLIDKPWKGSLLWEGVMLKSTPLSWCTIPFAERKNETMRQKLHGQKEKLDITGLPNLTHLRSHQSLLRLFIFMACYLNNECLLNQSWDGRKGAGGMRRVVGVVVPCNSCFWISEGDYTAVGGVRASKWTHFLCSFPSPDDILNVLGDDRSFCKQSPKPMTLTTAWGFCRSRLIPGYMSVPGMKVPMFVSYSVSWVGHLWYHHLASASSPRSLPTMVLFIQMLCPTVYFFWFFFPTRNMPSSF